MFNFRPPSTPAVAAPHPAPLASVSAVHDWGQSLIQLDVLTAHHQVCEVLERQLESMGGGHATSIGTVLALHELSQPWQDTLASQFCSPARLLLQQDEALRVALCRYDELFLQAYTAALPVTAAGELYPLREPGGLILGRMMHLLLEEAVWRFCHYLPCTDGAWYSAHWLVRQAEAQSLLGQAIILFPTPSRAAPVSVLSLYLQLVLLDLAWRHNLNRQEINEVRRWLAGHADQAGWLPASDEPDSFWIDLEQPYGALPHRPDAGGDCRRLSTWMLRQALNHTTDLPAGLRRRLARAWSVPLPARRVSRGSAAGEAELVCGFDQVMARLHGGQRYQDSAAGDLGDMRLYGLTQSQRSRLREVTAGWHGEGAPRGQAAHRWRLADSSSGGIGVSLPLAEMAGLGLGVLVAARLGGETDWRPGIIRRMRRIGTGNVLLGIEWLPPGCLPVWLKPIRAYRSREDEAALYVPLAASGQGDAALLLSPKLYAARQDWSVQLPQQTFRSSPDRILEGGADWCLCWMAAAPEDDMARWG